MKNKIEIVKLIIELFLLLSAVFASYFNKSIYYYLFDIKYILLAIVILYNFIVFIYFFSTKKKDYKIFISVPISIIIILLIIFINPYPKCDTITISGFYEEIGNHYQNTSNGDEFANRIIANFKKMSEEFSLLNNSSFQYFPIDAKKFILPNTYSENMNKDDYENNMRNNLRSPTGIVGFVKNSKIENIVYSLRKNIIFRDIKKSRNEIDVVNHIITYILNNHKLNENEKIDIISSILFLDINSRYVSYTTYQEITAEELGLYILNLVEEISKIKFKYNSLSKEINYLITGLMLSFIDAYHGDMSDEQISKVLIDSLSLSPYYPCLNEQEFASIYLNTEYNKHKNNGIKNLPILYELGNMIAECDLNLKERILNSAKKQIFFTYNSSILYLMLIDFYRLKKPFNEYTKKDLYMIDEINNLFLKAIIVNKNEKLTDFIILKQCLYYHGFIRAYLELKMDDKVDFYFSKIGVILDSNSKVRTLYKGIGNSTLKE
ncbi:MAG: hypothetical protein V1874_04135 [Spirochaetota bacterium]